MFLSKMITVNKYLTVLFKIFNIILIIIPFFWIFISYVSLQILKGNKLRPNIYFEANKIHYLKQLAFIIIIFNIKSQYNINILISKFLYQLFK